MLSVTLCIPTRFRLLGPLLPQACGPPPPITRATRPAPHRQTRPPSDGAISPSPNRHPNPRSPLEHSLAARPARAPRAVPRLLAPPLPGAWIYFSDRRKKSPSWALTIKVDAPFWSLHGAHVLPCVDYLLMCSE